MPRTQRIIVTDGSVLVHEAPRKRRSKKAAAPQPAEPVAPLQAEELQLEVTETVEPDVAEAAAFDLEPTEASALDLEAAEALEPELELAGESDDLSAALAAELAAEPEAEPEAEAEAAAPEFAAPSPRQATRSGEPPNGAGTLVLNTAVPGAPRTVTRARRTPAPPPPGWAIEFGTGRLVPLHGFKGRMSYPSSDD